MSEKSATMPVPNRFVQAISAYKPPASSYPIHLKLDANEAIDCHSESFTELIKDTPFHLYTTGDNLLTLLAKKHNISPEHVLITAGADDGLERAFAVFANANTEAIIPSPTFVMLKRYAAKYACHVVDIPWHHGDYPIDAVCDAINEKTRLITVVSPNNPTGLTIRPEQLETLAQKAPHAAILLDQAYGEFSDEDLITPALKYDNILIFKTYSKAFGLAGIRVGYVIAHPTLINWLKVAGNPYPCSAFSYAVAEYCLTHRNTWLNEHVATIKQQRTKLSQLLNDLGFDTPPSQGNFVWATHNNGLAIALYRYLLRRGIKIRAFLDEPELQHGVRITCPGTHEAFDELCDALTQLSTQQLMEMNDDDDH